jgi:hypothetical protein
MEMRNCMQLHRQLVYVQITIIRAVRQLIAYHVTLPAFPAQTRLRQVAPAAIPMQLLITLMLASAYPIITQTHQ